MDGTNGEMEKNLKRPLQQITRRSQGMIIHPNNQILIANKVGKQDYFLLCQLSRFIKSG
jgi:hypothetical protein